MARYIDADRLQFEADRFFQNEDVFLYDLTSLISMMPTADVVEVKHGTWYKVSELAPRYVCTCCHHLYNNMGYKYCPNCGAEMGEKALKEREKG